jgi:hypothetical protein
MAGNYVLTTNCTDTAEKACYAGTDPWKLVIIVTIVNQICWSELNNNPPKHAESGTKLYSRLQFNMGQN